MKPRSAQSLPWFLVLPGMVAIAFFLAPLVALCLQAPWGSMVEILTDGATLQALRLSAITATTATLVATVLGVPLAWLLARSQLAGTFMVRGLILIPLLIPPVVSGVALLAAFGRRGAIGQALYEHLGVQLPFTTAGVVLAQVFVAMPFLVISVEGGFRALGTRHEEAASTLGASPWTVFRRVTLPLMGPALTAGMALCWARALGEFGATITFAGSFPGVTQTMPLAVYSALESNRSAAIGLSVVLVITCLAVLFALRRSFLQPLVQS